MFFSHQEKQKKACDDRKNAKALPELHIGQEVLYIMTEDDRHAGKVTYIGSEPIGYMVATPREQLMGIEGSIMY